MSTKKPAKQTNARARRRGSQGTSGIPHSRKPKGLPTIEKLRSVLAKDPPGILAQARSD